MKSVKELNQSPLLAAHFPIEFDAVTAEQVQPAVHHLLALVKGKINALSAPTVPRTYDKLSAAVKGVDESVDKTALEPVHRRFLKKTVTGFRRAGVDLDDAGKRKLEELDVALAKATTKFSSR